MRRPLFALLAAAYLAGCGEAEAPTPADAVAVEMDTAAGPSLVPPGQADDSVATPLTSDPAVAPPARDAEAN